jgi:hypothetical protein
VDMVGLHREVHDAESLALSVADGFAHDAKDALGTEAR